MCNLYSHTTARQAVLRLFRVSDNRAIAFAPQPAIFPAGRAPVVRLASDGERELESLSWGFVLLQRGRAPRRVTNVRDDKLAVSPFWKGSFAERRCLVPASSFAEPKGRNPATWYWFALKGDEPRPPFAFAGIWRRWQGPLKKDGPQVDIEVFAFVTTRPNPLVASIHPARMPVILAAQRDHDTWLSGSPKQALACVTTYPGEHMAIVQSGSERMDLGAGGR